MIAYTHKVNARSRSMKISVDSKGRVVVSTPRLIPTFLVNRFVESHSEWIEHQVQKVSAVKSKLALSEHQVLLFGKVYEVKAELHQTEPLGVKRVGNILLVHPVSLTPASIQNTVNRFLKMTGSSYILKQVAAFGKIMHTSYNAVSFKTQKTRWGSCSSKGNLNFNWRLVHSPPEVINYVIIHELAHRTHMNHSHQFWALVAQYDPAYQQHRGWLKRHGIALQD